MKVALFAVWICIFAMPAFAHHRPDHGDQGDHHGAPAPLIGAGIPFLAAGGALFGWKLLKRK
jgi:hypothetical protein